MIDVVRRRCLRPDMGLTCRHEASTKAVYGVMTCCHLRRSDGDRSGVGWNPLRDIAWASVPE